MKRGMTVLLTATPPADRRRTSSPCPSRVTGSSSFIMRSRIQAPVGAELALAVAVAAGHRDDLLRARAALGLEILEGQAEFLTVLHQPAEPHRVLQRERSALAGMRAGGVRGVADQKRALRDQVGKVATSSVSVTTMFSAASMICGIGSCQPAWKSRKCCLHRVLAHGAERRGVDAVRGLRAPPHHAVVGIGAAKAVAEESALPERRLDALPDRRVRQARERGTKPPKPIRPVSNGFGPSGITCVAHRRMHAVGADHEIAFGAWCRRQNARRPAGRRGPRWRRGAFRNAARRSRTRPC